MNEIITFGKGYTLNSGIKVFVKSAKEVCENVTVLSWNLDEEIKHLCEAENVNFYDCSELAVKFNVNNSVSPYTLKVIYYYLYSKFVSNSTNIYVCDFTDTFFQQNVFDLINNNKPYVTTENFFIKNCPTNQLWLKHCYGEDMLNNLKEEEIINGTGNVFGNRLAVVNLLKDLCRDLSIILNKIDYPIIDQACINKVVRSQPNDYNILNNFEVFNLAHYGNSDIDTTNKKISVNQRIPYVMHQYDVVPALKEFLYNKYN